MKHLFGKIISDRLKNGDTIGIGSGTTVEAALVGIHSRIKGEGLTIYAVATSYQSARLAAQAGVTVIDPDSECTISWAFDGADEVDPAGGLIKGRGAAQLQEKILAARSGGISVLITPEKLVNNLGERMPVPVEVVQSARFLAERELRKLGASEVTLRMAQGKFGPIYTEARNLILDCRFPKILPELERLIAVIPGVVESGLFFGLTKEVLIAREGGVFRRGPDGVESPI